MGKADESMYAINLNTHNSKTSTTLDSSLLLLSSSIHDDSPLSSETSLNMTVKRKRRYKHSSFTIKNQFDNVPNSKRFNSSINTNENENVFNENLRSGI